MCAHVIVHGGSVNESACQVGMAQVLCAAILEHSQASHGRYLSRRALASAVLW